MTSPGAPSLFGGLSITKKLTLSITSAALLTGLAIGGISLWSASEVAYDNAVHRLDDHAARSAQALDAFVDQIDGDLNFLRTSQLGGRSFSDLARAWDSLPGDKEAFLKDTYIASNPNPVGEKQLLKDTGANDMYAAMHSKHHMSYRSFQESRGYYDLFLINNQGDVIYSVFKENDFGSNLISGSLAESGLATAFNLARENPAPDYIAFADIDSYAPSGGAPAGFFAIPLLNNKGEFIGALALQTPAAAINTLMSRNDQPALGLRSFLVGADGLLRSDSPDTEADDTLETRYVNDAVTNSAIGAVSHVKATSLLGNPSISAATNVDVHGVQWTVVVEESIAGINSQVNALRDTIAFSIAPVLLAIGLLGWLLARSFARPIIGIAAQVSRLAAGENATLPGLARRDEIGDLARSLGAIHSRSIESQRIASALTHSDAMVMITDEDMNIVYVNQALEAGLTKVLPALQKLKPGVTVDGLIGLNADIFHHQPDVNRDSANKPRGADSAPIRLGDRRFALSITRILDHDGTLIGYGVTWHDRTDSLEIEQQVASVMGSVAQGDFSKRLKLRTSEKFLVDVADGVNRICEVSDAFLKEMNDVMAGVSAGELTHRMASTHAGTLSDVAQNVNATVAKISKLVSDIKNATSSMGETTTSIADGAQELSGRTEAQASSLEETAATMEEMTANVKANAENAGKANRLAQDAADRARGGKDVMEDAVSAMSLIEESSSKISDIISVIESIAFQTNLLALNAAVEAARAGEAGKGFAVVAAEVRTLAQRSSQAAKDITSLIQDSSEHVGQGVKLVTSTGDALQEIVQAIAKVADTIEDISSASREQSSGVEEISVAVSHMDEMTQKNSTMAEQSAAAARGLQNETAWLVDLISFFKVDEKEAKAARAGQAASARNTGPAPSPKPAAPARSAPPSKTAVPANAPAAPRAPAKATAPAPGKPMQGAAHPSAQQKSAGAAAPAKPASPRPAPRSAPASAAAASAKATDQDWSEF